MAIYHLSIRPISRGKGQSIVHKAAYNARTKLHQDKAGIKTKNYKNQGPLLFERIFLPKDAPDWAHNREALWNKVEDAEVRKDARFGREINIALPHELTIEQNQSLLEEFVQEAFVSHGMVADVVIHTATHKGDPRNMHAHVLLPTRAMTSGGFSKIKDRSWNSTAVLQAWRAMWADKCNRFLEIAGHDVRVSHASYKDRGVDVIPTKHVGPHIMRMEAKGIRTRRGDYLRSQGTEPLDIVKED